MDTDLIRPRSDATNNNDQQMTPKMAKFDLNEEILARWTDQQFYPARITTFYSKGQYCQVLFYDGYRKKVKVSSLRKMPDNYEGEQIPPPSILPVSSPSLLPTTSSTILSPLNVETPESLQKNNSFVCDICEKEFRKESLLLQHKKHFHKTELDDVPSLVPPQLRIHKTNRHEKQKSHDSGDDTGKVSSKIKTEIDISSEDGMNELIDRGKRKNESTPSPTQSND
ncbi:TUDOR domain containing protein, partial [Euroglyphus maynei]